MAIQRSERALGNPPLPTILEVNDETGEASLYVNEGLLGRTLLATVDNVGDEWTIRNQFRRRWNTRNGLSLSKAEFDDFFNTDLKKGINNDKAFLINEHSSNDVKKALKDAGVPGVKDPTTGTTASDTTETPTVASTTNEGGDTNTTSSGTGSETSVPSLNIPQPEVREGEGMPSGPPLSYPVGMSSSMNKLQINIREYSPKGVKQISNNTGAGSLETPARQKGKIIQTIFLPIPGGIQDQNQVSWGKGDMNALQQAAAEFALSAIGGGADDATETARDLAKRLQGNTEEAKTAVANILAGGAAGIGAQLLTRTTGAIINPNAELLFQGPSMRQFGFSFNMSARSSDEARVISLIIRSLKQGMSVRRSKSGLFLMSPHLFELKYVTGDNSYNPHLNKFKMCAMTGMNVNYTPNQTFMALENNMPVAYQVDMQFQELEPIFNDDYSNDNSIGY
jgi:hypothetical protein